MAQPSLQGTLKPHSSFNADQDAHTLKNAMAGAGTDEAAITSVMTARSNGQRVEISQKYKILFGKELKADFESELSGNFQQLMVALLKSPTAYDVDELHRAMKGGGTDEDALVEILCTRSNSDIANIKSAYKLSHKSDLEKDLVGESSGHFRRLLVSLSTGNRPEDSNVDDARVKQDAKALYDAGEKRWGTDESVFNQILCARSCAHVRAVNDEYNKVSKKTLDKAIQSEMSGDLERGMLAVLHAVCNKPRYFAERLHSSMKGLGTTDNTLIRVVVSRCEVDMVQIKEEFQREYKKTLESFISGDTSGDYSKALLALIGAKK